MELTAREPCAHSGKMLVGVGARVSEKPVVWKKNVREGMSVQLRVPHYIRKGGLEAWVGSGRRGTARREGAHARPASGPRHGAHRQPRSGPGSRLRVLPGYHLFSLLKLHTHDRKRGPQRELHEISGRRGGATPTDRHHHWVSQYQEADGQATGHSVACYCPAAPAGCGPTPLGLPSEFPDALKAELRFLTNLGVKHDLKGVLFIDPRRATHRASSRAVAASPTA